MKSIKRVWAVLKKEVLHIMRDKVMFMICFLASVFLTCIFGFVYSQGKATQVPIVVYDGDQTELSRMLINGFNDSERISIIKYVDSFDELQKYMDSQKAEAAIFIPQGLKKNAKNGMSQEITVIVNGTNILVMNTVANAINTVISTFSAGINMKVMEANGISSKKAFQYVQALSYKSKVWYNATTDYGAFMLLGLIGTIIQQLSFLAVALSFTREKESGAWKNLIFSKLKSKEIISGKFLVYFSIFFINALIVFSLATNYFDIPQRGNLLLLMGINAIFIAAVIMLGIFLSALFKSQVQAIEISMIIAVPSYILSGYTWPSYNMPMFLQKISHVLPLTHYLRAVKGVMYMGQSYAVVKPEINFLIGLFILFIPVNILLVQRKMRIS